MIEIKPAVVTVIYGALNQPVLLLHARRQESYNRVNFKSKREDTYYSAASLRMMQFRK